MAAAADLYLLAAGYGMLLLLGVPRRVRLGVLGTLGFSYLSGVALLGTLTTVYGVLGLPVHVMPLLVPSLLAIIAAGVTRRVMQGPAHPRVGLSTRALAVLPEFPSLAVISGFTAWLVVVESHQVVDLNDEYAIWARSGHALWYLGRLDPRFFADTASHMAQLDYPLLVASLYAWNDGWAGHIADGAAIAQSGLLLGALLCVVAWTLTRLCGPVAAIAGVLGVLGTQILLSNYSIELIGDAPMACFAVSLALVLLLWWLWDEPIMLNLAAVLTAGATLTKNEGSLAVLAAFIAAALVCGGSVRRRLPCCSRP